MANLEKDLLKELKRFNQIGYNATNLQEQMLGGFQGLGMGSHVDRIMGTKKSELGEQEDPEAEVDDAAPEVTTFDEMGVGDEEVDLDVDTTPAGDTPPPPPPAPTTPAPATPAAEPAAEEENTTEVEVTDLVDKQENLEKNTEETNDKLESLMDMLDGMEEKLSGMDQLMNQISSLEQKIEKYRPKSEREKLEMRKLDSGPYNQTLVDFWDDSQEKFEAQGKTEYTLTPEDVENFSDTDIQKSFNV